MSDSDEEYGPITASWGTQAPVEPAKPEGWDSLIDPNVKVGPNDVGSGNLHRRGTNFKPINEELILAQRKNIQVPKKKMLEAIRATEMTLGLPETKEKPRKAKPKKKSGKPTLDKFSHSKPHAPTTNYIPPPPSTTRPPPLATDGNSSSWLNTNLVDTPFWEKKINVAPTTTINTKVDSKTIDSNDWASAVKEVTSDQPVAQDDSPTEWTMSSKVNPEKTKPAASVTWGSSNKTDNAAVDNWGSVKTQGFTENKGRYAKAGKAREAEAPTDTNWASNQPQSLTTNNQWAKFDKSNKTEWQSTTNNRQTPASRDAPADTSNNNDWGSGSTDNNWGATNNNNWASSSATTNTTNYTTNTSTESWGSTNGQSGNWGVDSANESSTTWGSTTSTINNNSGQHIPSDKPSWLNSIPDKQSQSSRFSNPHKQRYSEVPIDIPEPVNYRRDGRITPLRTAPPPPPENSLLITIMVEMSDTIKVPVDIRELDDPYQLAVDFGTKNNVNSPKVIDALTKLFTGQKELGLKKKNQKLQRRVQPKNYDNVYNSNNQSPPSKYSTYSRPSSTASSPTPFARKVYY